MYVGGGGGRKVLQILHKTFCSQGDHSPKDFIAQ